MTRRYRLQCHPRFAPDDAVSTARSRYTSEADRPVTPPPDFSPNLHNLPPIINQSQGRYDDLKTAQENIDLQTTILSRFDLIFIVRDERLYERDLAIADHVLGIHAGHGGEIGDDGSIVPVGQDKNPEAERQVKFLKRYVEYCRATCSPRLQPKSARLLEDQYVRYRQEMRERAKKGGAPAVPITVRQLEAITPSDILSAVSYLVLVGMVVLAGIAAGCVHLYGKERPDVSENDKIGWTLGFVFLPAIILPVYWVIRVRGHDD